MSRSVQSVAQNGTRITDAARDAAASATQMERSIESVTGLTRSADELARRVSRDAEEGGATVQRSIQGISRMRDSMTQSAAVMREMGKRTGDITSIVDTINLIAERTNLLSLNASIEAARAGDAGRGFAVVAEEIRTLADRSARATADIAAIIRALQETAQDAVAASSDGLRVADESSVLAESGGAALKKILSGIGETAGLIGQIAGAAGEQRTTGQTVVHAIAATTDQARLIATSTAEQAAAALGIVRSTGQMRKISQEVAKAISEQGRAARDIIKAAGGTARLASQVRKATAEQAKSAVQIAQANDSMRRGASATTRTVAQQALSAEEIVKAGETLARMSAQVSGAMVEQRAAAAEVATATAAMRTEADQSAKALREQGRAMRDITGAAANTAKQVKLITAANRVHSQGVASVVDDVAAVRRIAERNAGGVRDARSGTGDLLRNAEALSAMVTDLATKTH
jgi:methyl-accepting chemotaxis protein